MGAQEDFKRRERMRIIDDSHRLGDFFRELEDDLTRDSRPPVPGAPAMLARTVEVESYPTEPDCYFGVRGIVVTGDEVEGGPATLTESKTVGYFFNLGDAVPDEGSLLVLDYLPYRWVATVGSPRTT